MNHEKLGVAIDIGTTTVALHLLDIATGVKLATESGVNTQVPFGADVTSRIRYCAQNGHEKLTLLIREQIASMITEACSQAEKQTENIEHITIAANTIMQHIIAGYSPVSMGVAPFTPVSLFGEELPVWEDLPVAKNALIYYPPAISAYVGGDITAGLLAAGFEDIKDPSIFLDIGTNGEIVLKHNNTYYCCATAAGPAFEGAEITMGMAAEPGAIDHVWLGTQGDGSVVSLQEHNRTVPLCSTIGGAKPIGLCGSGLLDTLAVLLDIGAIDETGRLLNNDKFYLAKREENTPHQAIEHDVYITAGDIRKLQLAKAAIAAGIEVLLHFAGISIEDVKTLALAGGFGSYMDTRSAARIGLFPKILLPKAKTLGNTAGEGAALAVGSIKAREQLKKIHAKCEYIELSSIAFFNDKFVDQMTFEE